MEEKPIKRHTALKPLSREHHHGLLLCWKIRTGIKKEREVLRIWSYVNWFHDNYLAQHFEAEENYIYPILGNENELVKKAVSEHQKIRHLIQAETQSYKNLNLIAEILENHIRFEERSLFNEIQAIATKEQLQQINRQHTEAKFIDNLNDPFWE